MPSAVPQKDHPGDGWAKPTLEAPSSNIARIIAWIGPVIIEGVAGETVQFAGDCIVNCLSLDIFLTFRYLLRNTSFGSHLNRMVTSAHSITLKIRLHLRTYRTCSAVTGKAAILFTEYDSTL